MAELTDSGVSVVSDVPPSINKDIRLIPRFKETDKKVDLKHSCRHGKRYGSRSGSLERPNRETWSMGVPAQPFVADPGMPPLTPPHTVDRNYSSLFTCLTVYALQVYIYIYIAGYTTRGDMQEIKRGK